MRRLLILSIVLIGCIGLQRLVSGWHYVLSGAPGTLLYAATFEAFTDEWEQSEGRQSMQVVNGALQITVGVSQKAAWSLSKPYFSDFDVHAEAQAVDGSLDNAYGLIFRFFDNDNYYYFVISSDGWYRVKRRVNGIEKIISNWIASPLIRQGLNVTNELRVIAYHNQFQFFINGGQVPVCIPDNPEGISTPLENNVCKDGKMLDTLVDDSIASGQLGVIIEVDQSQQPGVVVDFDNLVVLAPQPIEG